MHTYIGIIKNKLVKNFLSKKKLNFSIDAICFIKTVTNEY